MTPADLFRALPAGPREPTIDTILVVTSAIGVLAMAGIATLAWQTVKLAVRLTRTYPKSTRNRPV